MESASQTRAAASLRALLTGLIDYAGLFPPAGLRMEEAVANYARYLSGEHRWALGRFIVPVARLAEFREALGKVEIVEPWVVSAIAGPDAASDGEALRKFNEAMSERAVIDAVEVKAASAGDVARIRPLLGDELTVYFEIPTDAPAELFDAIRTVMARAKIRTGGLVESAFPSAEKIAQFIVRCVEAKVAFKATAGLHHPLRCLKPLTYAADAPTGTMHGFLNVFLAACCYGGLGEQVNRQYRADARKAIVAFLLNDRPEKFVFDDERVTVGGALPEAFDGRVRDVGYTMNVTTEIIRHVRENFAIAFGSCSFEEPIEDLRSLNLL